MMFSLHIPHISQAAVPWGGGKQAIVNVKMVMVQEVPHNVLMQPFYTTSPE